MLGGFQAVTKKSREGGPPASALQFCYLAADRTSDISASITAPATAAATTDAAAEAPEAGTGVAT